LCRYVTGSISEEISQEILVKQVWRYPCPCDINTIEIINSEGTQTIVQPQFDDDEKYFEYKETDVPGIYAVTANGKLHPQFPAYFPVNIDTAESNLEKIDQNEITAFMGGTKLSMTAVRVSKESDVLLGETKKNILGISIISYLLHPFCRVFRFKKIILTTIFATSLSNIYTCVYKY